MQATLLRSHVREEAQGLEAELEYAITMYPNSDAGNEVKKLLKGALKKHQEIKKHYDQWDYKAALYSALQALSLVDQALTLMGEPDRIHDPITEFGLAPFE